MHSTITDVSHRQVFTSLSRTVEPVLYGCNSSPEGKRPPHNGDATRLLPGIVVTVKPESMYVRSTHRRARMSCGALNIGVLLHLVVVVVHPMVEGNSTTHTRCVSDLDCSLNGVCLASGQCDCDAAWEVRVWHDTSTNLSQYRGLTTSCSPYH